MSEIKGLEVIPLTGLTKGTQYLSDSSVKLAVQLFLPILGHKYDMVFTIPSDMR